MKVLNLKYIKPIVVDFKNQQPYSDQFDDVYFNDTGGIQESEFVFIKHNHLIDRWELTKKSASFCIAETGFGTGLNFLTVTQKWQQQDDKPRHLHFISFEQFPLDLSSMQKSHACFPELAASSKQLLSHWGNFRSGLQQIKFNDQITLSLVLGDANAYIGQITAAVDAWFLDGFAPSKNPDLWNDNLFNQINRLSRPGTTLSTFTATSQVNKALNRNGFKVRKVRGFGKKREMITAEFVSRTYQSPRRHVWDPLPKQHSKTKKVSIVGAGIAGLCLAQYFKKAGYQTTVIDQNELPMQQASGNEMAMVMPLITARESPESLFYIRAYETALGFYNEDELKPIGINKLLLESKQKRWATKLESINLPAEILSIQPTDPSSAYYPESGYVDTKHVASRLSQAVDYWINADTQKLKQDHSGQWHLLDQHHEVFHSTDLLIIAAGIQSQQLLNPFDLSLIAKHGQTTTIKAPDDLVLDSIQLHHGYLIPNVRQNQWLCGATFDHVPLNQNLTQAKLASDHWQRNLTLWEDHPLYQFLKQATVLSGFAAFRATTPDHLPICGPVINQQQFRTDCADLHHGRHWINYPPAMNIDNLYVLSGLGSRGFTSAPILAKYLSAMILAEPLPLEADLCKIIHPNRFLYRSLKKRNNNS